METFPSPGEGNQGCAGVSFFCLLLGCPHNHFWVTVKGEAYYPNVNHCISVTYFALKVSQWESCNEIGSQSPAEDLVMCELGTF